MVWIQRHFERGIAWPILAYEKFLSPTPTQVPFWGVSRVENGFLEIILDEIKELQLVLELYQTAYGRYTLRSGGLPHPVQRGRKPSWGGN